MKQSLHIFRKDVRHLWRDLCAYAILLVAFGIVSEEMWMPTATTSMYLEMLNGLMSALLPMCWLFLITRAVHDESLVGDQQFWVTRPYRWTSLLGAKLLFLTVCVALPFLLVQAGLLLYAGLNPLAAIPGLLQTLLNYAVVVWLPLTLAAALTATVPQAFMAIVALILLDVGLLSLSLFKLGPRMVPPGAFTTFGVVSAVLLVGTLLYQYATRDTARSRRVFAAAFSAAILLYCAAKAWNASAPMSALVRTVYAESRPLHLTFDPAVQRVAVKRSHSSALPDDLVPVTLPFDVAGLSKEDRLFEPQAMFTVTTPSGRYTSPWQPVNIIADGIGLLVPQRVLQSSGRAAVPMHLALIATRLTPGRSQIITAAERFVVPGGNCILREAFAGSNATCRFPFEHQTPMTVTGNVTKGECDAAAATQPATAQLRTIFGVWTDPVVQIPLRMGGTICPGTQLTFTPFREDGKVRMELDATPVNLDSFRDQ